MNPPLHAAPQRAHFLDWLRIAAFGLLVVYHVGMYYVSWGWHVKSPFAGAGLEPWMMLTAPWRMALLFLVSGAATSFLLKRGTGGAFLAGRSRRLLLPLLCGVLLIVPPQAYFEVVFKHGYAGDYLDFLRLYFTAYGGFCRAGQCLILPTWNHLWFVAYLWVYTLALWALLRWRPMGLDTAAARCETWLTGARLLWLPIGLLALTRLVLYPRFPSTHALVDDVYNHAVYLPLFLAGAVFARCESLWDRFARQRRAALLLALAGYAVLAAFAGGLVPLMPPGDATPALKALHRVAFATVQWSALAAALGFARQHLDHDHRWRRTLTEAVFPVYLLHQTLIIGLAQVLLPLRWTPALEAPVLIIGTFVLSAAGYTFVRRIGVLRPWFGLAGVRAHGIGPALRTTVAALCCFVLIGPLLGCAAAAPLQRSGQGTPAVVFQSGLGDGPDVWRTVLPRVQAVTTAVALQRPGYGGSALPPGSRDACTIAAEQRAALQTAGIAPPYVLVGHSLGGLYQYVYARLYPHDVAALVLVDPTHPEH
jgi:glucans biosynthesis protein C